MKKHLDKILLNINLDEKDKIKAIRRGMRDAEIKDLGYKGFKQTEKVCRNKKKYYRKEKHKKDYQEAF